jgi:hypothetical protein
MSIRNDKSKITVAPENNRSIPAYQRYQIRICLRKLLITEDTLVSRFTTPSGKARASNLSG